MWVQFVLGSCLAYVMHSITNSRALRNNFKILSTDSKSRTTLYRTAPQEVLLSSFHLNGHTLGYYPDSKVSLAQSQSLCTA